MEIVLQIGFNLTIVAHSSSWHSKRLKYWIMFTAY